MISTFPKPNLLSFLDLDGGEGLSKGEVNFWGLVKIACGRACVQNESLFVIVFRHHEYANPAGATRGELHQAAMHQSTHEFEIPAGAS